MKNLISVFIILLSFFYTVNAQSLAEITGEKSSLYNAICKYNGLIPGEVTMTEARKLIQNYTEEIGCKKYYLHKYNAGNNLYILYKEPKKVNIEKKAILRQFTVEELKDYLEDSLVGKDNTCGGCYTINEVAPLQVKVVVKHIRTLEANELTMPKEVVDLSSKATTEPNLTKEELFCDCRNKDYYELNNYYTLMLKNRQKEDDRYMKDKYGFCATQIRKYKRNHSKRLLKEVKSRGTKVKLVKNKNKKRKSKKLRGNTVGKSDTFIHRIFPFLACK